MAGCPGNGIIAFNADGRDECLDCRDRCEGFFPGNASLIDGCKSACEGGNTEMYTQNDYLTLIGQGEEQVAEENDNYNAQVAAAEAAQTKIYIGIGLVVLIVIIVMVVIKKVK
jgi:hypothetical protein